MTYAYSLTLTDPTIVGEATKKSDYQKAFNNTLALLERTPDYFGNLHLRTHPDFDKSLYQVYLHHADYIVMDDGEVIRDWDRLIADVTAAGAGGLSAGYSEDDNRMYGVWAIRKKSNGDKALILVPADAFDSGAGGGFAASTTNTQIALRDAAARTQVAQSFQVVLSASGTTGRAGSCEFKAQKSGSPTGHFWVELQTDSAGVPSGTVLSTSDKYDVSTIYSGGGQVMRAMFRNLSSDLVDATVYHLVFRGDFAIDGANYVVLHSKTGNPYALGAMNSHNGTSWSSSGTDDMYIAVYVVVTYDMTYPTGYDQKRLIGYAYNNGSSNFEPFQAYNRYVHPLKNFQLTSGAIDPPALQYLFPYIPIGRVRLRVHGRNPSAATSCNISLGGVPNGYPHPSVSHRAHGVHWASSDGVTTNTLECLTEDQGAYIREGGGVGVTSIDSWEWL